MTTAKLDAVGHHWVSDLASYHFTLDRGRDNIVADCLGCSVPEPDDPLSETVFMDEETVQEALGRAELGTGNCAALHDPFLVHLHQSIEEEIRSMGIQPKEKMLIVNWETAQAADPTTQGIIKWMREGKKQPLQTYFDAVTLDHCDTKECICQQTNF